MQVSETLINRNIIDRTNITSITNIINNITEMNITETKTKEETFTDLIMGTAESNKYTTETEGKTISAT